MDGLMTCPECGAARTAGKTCQDDFHQMLFWEDQYPELGTAHHLMVLCYHLQHPSLYSPEGLAYAMGLLVDFVETGLSTGELRRRNRHQLSSSQRDWRITASPGSHASYARPPDWTLRAADVVAAGPGSYVGSVRDWAASVLADLRLSGNLPEQSHLGTGE